MSKIMVKCAFCHGAGVDPFGIMSGLSNCYVCGGKGEVEIEEPYQVCPFCHGTGIHPNTRMDCLVCSGKGINHIKEPVETCRHCGGTGAEPGSALPCLVCKGKGTITTGKLVTIP